MALVYQCDIACLVCGNIIEQGETQHGTAVGLGKGARQVAAKHGWRLKKGPDGEMHDLCPDCLIGWPGNAPTWLLPKS